MKQYPNDEINKYQTVGEPKEGFFLRLLISWFRLGINKLPDIGFHADCRDSVSLNGLVYLEIGSDPGVDSHPACQQVKPGISPFLVKQQWV